MVLRVVEPGPGEEPDDEPRRYQILDLDELLEEAPPPVEWVWDGYFERGTLSILHGDGGLGKSYLALALGKAIARGSECLGCVAQQGGVMIVDAENSLREMHRRVHRIKLRAGDPITIIRTDYSLLVAGDGFAEVDELVSWFKPTLLILDSQRALWAGDEKEQAEVGIFLRLLANYAERAAVAILLIHHDNKSGGYSGSSDINAAVTGSRLHLHRPKNITDQEADPEKRRLRVLSNSKNRSDVEQPPVCFEIVHDDLLGVEFVVRTPPDREVSEERAGALRSVIIEYYTQHGPAHKSAVRGRDAIPGFRDTDKEEMVDQLVRESILEKSFDGKVSVRKLPAYLKEGEA